MGGVLCLFLAGTTTGWTFFARRFFFRFREVDLAGRLLLFGIKGDERPTPTFDAPLGLVPPTLDAIVRLRAGSRLLTANHNFLPACAIR